MKFLPTIPILIVLTVFLTGRAAAAGQAKDSETADAVKGKQVYEQKCEICHYSASVEKKIGLGLAGLMKRDKFRNGMKADDENLRRVIERGGKNMPRFRSSLKPAQIRDLIAYVKTL
ncbi:MAG: c-type cytochrome [Candidatus Acidiferrales bacterium]